MKKILFIRNCKSNNNFNNISNISIDIIYSDSIIDYTYEQLLDLVSNYDIIIIGGGPQHITTKSFHPELDNLYKIIQIIELYPFKILIGICLGFQIICNNFGCEIKPLNSLCIGFNKLDINSINHNICNNDKFLKNLNFNILSHSFSFHYDYVYNINVNIDLVAISNSNVPYVIKKNNLYGFQFHPELDDSSLCYILNNYPTNDLNKNIILSNNLDHIKSHFFDSLKDC